MNKKRFYRTASIERSPILMRYRCLPLATQYNHKCFKHTSNPMFTRTHSTTNACNRFYLYYMGIRMWYDSIFMENAWYILFYKNAIIHGSEIPSRSNYIFSPHIQCVCFVAFSDQAKKKKLKLKIKRLLHMNSFVHTKKLYISEPNWLPILIAYFPWKASYVSCEYFKLLDSPC